MIAAVEGLVWAERLEKLWLLLLAGTRLIVTLECTEVSTWEESKESEV